MLKGRYSAGMILIVAALTVALGLAARRVISEVPAAQSDAKGGERREVDSRSSTPHVRLGKLQQPAGRVATIPVYYGSGHTKEIGSIRAEMTIPGSSWIFQTAETPKGAWWKIFSREKPEKESTEAGKAERKTLLELNFSSVTRALPEGLIGYLHFKVEPAGSPLPAGTVIRRIEMSALSSQPSRIGPSSGDLPTLSSGPINPVTSCFFYMH